MSKKQTIDKYKEKTLVLSEFKKLSLDEQQKSVKEILNYMYEGKVKIVTGMVNKCVKLSLIKQDDVMILTKHLVVEKNAKNLVFKFDKRSNSLLTIILFAFALLVGLVTATYFGLLFLKYADLNKDIDKDGIADLNIDLNNNKVADINIDNDSDNKPDINIDYKGNQKDVFNIDKDNDGKADFNLVNDASGGNYETCLTNCDSNGDGWPDFNYDVDGDGKADFDIYSSKNKTVQDSIDLNGDMVCDVMCDDDKDGTCDRNCITNKDEILGSGPSTSTGDGGASLDSSSFVIDYEGDGALHLSDLFPDDQGVEQNLPVIKFKVTNYSDYALSYPLELKVDNNTYTSENFQFKVESTNNGYNSDYKVVPWEDTVLKTNVLISPGEVQEYVMTFKLHGTGEEQNYDQGKSFDGYIKVGE